ncbi:MAG TPA: hypothetical protein VF262_10875, partial [Burkholderiales bacterium]
MGPVWKGLAQSTRYLRLAVDRNDTDRYHCGREVTRYRRRLEQASPATLHRLSRHAIKPSRLAREPQANARKGNAMDWSHIESGWKEYQVNAKNRWNKLTNELL